MYCNKCGANNKDAAVFCGKCGEKMDAGTDSVSRPAPQAPAPQTAPERPKRGKKGLIICITAVVAVIAVAAVVLSALSAAPNKAMNINGSIALEDRGWIYYSNSADDYSLYMIRTDNYDKAKLNSEASDSFYVTPGWLYYRIFSGDHRNSICRMRKDGSGREVIKEDANASRMLLYKEWIFYTTASPESPNDGRYLHRIRTDGTEETSFDAQPLGDAFDIMGGWIYYIDSSDSSCYKMQIDGTGKTKMNEDCNYLALSADWIYYNDDGRLSKMRADRTDSEKLTDDLARNINLAGEWVYYINVSDGESVYKVRTDGTERTKLNGDSAMRISIAEDWIYYVNTNEGGDIYRMKTDGSERQRVE